LPTNSGVVSRTDLELDAYERGALETAGQALSIFYAQLTGDGLGSYDALTCAGYFHDACQRMVEFSWADGGTAIKEKLKNPGPQKIADIVPDYPDCRKHAIEFDRLFSQR
jgi:hypothetical protein